MEIATQQSETQKKKRSLDQDPQYFGAYLNMARHNVFLIVNHLTDTFKELNFKKLANEEDIWKVDNSSNILLNVFDVTQSKYEDFRPRIFHYLIKRHHLPLVKIFNTEYLGENILQDKSIDYERLHQFLCLSFKELTEFRNSYSHSIAIDENGNKVGRKTTLANDLVPEVNLLFKYAPKYSFLRNHQTLNEGDFQHLDNYQLFIADNQLTHQGRFFFINLFLERSYGIKFLKRFRGFKNENTPPFKATIQSFTTYCLKVPDIRLGNENPKQSLLLDMLTELNKCPKELFNHLTEDDKKEFEPNLDETSSTNVLLNSTNYEFFDTDEVEEAIRELTAQKRHSDRFPYLALRFLDETMAFSQLRFQLSLGKIIIKKPYQKTILGQPNDRIITKKLNVFGRISDFLNREKEIIRALSNDQNVDFLEFEQFFPHYNINNNKIAFYFLNDSDLTEENLESRLRDQENRQPTGFLSIHDLPKLVLLHLLAPSEVQKTLQRFINDNNPAFFDLELLANIKSKVVYEPSTFTKRSEHQYRDADKQEEETEKQQEYQTLLNQRKRLLEQHLPKGVKINQIPEKVLDFLMNISEPNENKVIHQKIKSIKDEAKTLLQRVKNKQAANEIPKLGELATFLTRDIINMVVSEELKKKITSPYSNKLQNKIAFFSLSKQEIISLLSELQLLNNEKGHVFLSSRLILESNGLLSFYKSYLEAKIAWIDKNLFLKGKKGGYIIPENKPVPKTLQKIKQEVSQFDFTQWLQNKAAMPIDVPNTIFDVSLENLLKTNLKKRGITVKDTDKFSVLLNKYLDKDTQPFYKYGRVYKIQDEEESVQVVGKMSKTLKKQYGKFVEENEKVIRFYQSKDRVIKLMCNALLQAENKTALTDSFKLAHTHPNSKQNPLDTPMRFEQKLFSNDKETKVLCTIYAQDTENQKNEILAWNSLSEDDKKYWLTLTTKEAQKEWLSGKPETEQEVYHGQKGYQWTIKEVGKFKRFVKDRRIPALVNYFETTKLPFSLLEYQLKEYDRVREQIFDGVFKLEEAISQKDLAGIWALEQEARGRKNYHQVQFNIFEKYLQNTLPSYDPAIGVIRNKFSHNEFPDLIGQGIEKISQAQIDDYQRNKHLKDYLAHAGISIAQQILAIFEQKINDTLTQLTTHG
ncbi:MAG: type VI-B CRISPR-associated RNA-guided ribonuclease Cas13b [Bacteroidetes bacterium]|nr:type VI-B CRISPR-associated RNA-guided ribonuclease Cas13b [Bacteroidota bacterium]